MGSIVEVQNALLRGHGLMHENRDPWWIIGSAAMLLFGHKDIEINDVDFLVSERDAKVISRRLGLPNQADSGSTLFRSPFLLRPPSEGVEVEIMAGLEINHAGTWNLVILKTRQSHDWKGLTVFTPDRTELTALYRRIGRDKDLRRADQLDS